MAIFSALFSLLAKRLGQLVRAVFGWSITGLFGRLSTGKQTALSVALILSLLWPLLVVGCFLPNVAAWALAFVPLEQWVGRGVLRGIWVALALAAPIGVGAITRWVAPDRKQRGRLATILSGYPLTLGYCLSFLITLCVYPALKITAVLKRWKDEHVYVQPDEGKYREVLAAVRAACEAGGFMVREAPVPTLMALPVRVIKFFARGGLDPVVPDDPRMLRGQGVELYLYPADLLLRGKPELVARARAVLARELLRAPAHLVEDAGAQKIEDEIQRMWGVVARHGREELGSLARGRVEAIASELDRATLPFDQWVLLYTNLHHLERAVCGGPRLVDHEHPEPKLTMTREVAMNHTDPRPGASTADLVREALDEVRALVKAEIALARDEVRQEAAGVKKSALAFAGAVVAGALGVAFLLIGFALAIFPHALPAFIVAGVLLVVAGVAVAIGVASLPKKPLDHTRERIETDAQILKEQLA